MLFILLNQRLSKHECKRHWCTLYRTHRNMPIYAEAMTTSICMTKCHHICVFVLIISYGFEFWLFPKPDKRLRTIIYICIAPNWRIDSIYLVLPAIYITKFIWPHTLFNWIHTICSLVVGLQLRISHLYSTYKTNLKSTFMPYNKINR